MILALLGSGKYRAILAGIRAINIVLTNMIIPTKK
jgi:hypothetical protein